MVDNVSTTVDDTNYESQYDDDGNFIGGEWSAFSVLYIFVYRML